LGSNDVEVKIKLCGVCASDIMLLKHQIPGYPHPLVAGHEGVGIVTEIGSGVKSLKPGDRVGVGVYRNCCKNCQYCFNGDNNLCSTKALTFMGGNSGAFADIMRLDAQFAVPIPEGISDADAAPLMCAGHTTFTPFRKHNVKVGDKVGIVGIGGLGHLSIQYANKLGCEVYVISGSTDKEKESRSLGAHHFVNSKDLKSFDAVKGTFNFLMVTASGSGLPWPQLLSSMAPDGKVILMGAGLEPIPIPSFSLIASQISIVGSAAGTSSSLREMLQFSSKHNIKPMVQTFPFEQINEVLAAVSAGSVRYRAVLVNSS